MLAKTIASTQAQNNFGQILDDVTQNGTRYVIKRHHKAQAMILSLADFERILNSQPEQQIIKGIIQELKPVYAVGEAL